MKVKSVIGQQAKHSKRPEWGPGIIEDIPGDSGPNAGISTRRGSGKRFGLSEGWEQSARFLGAVQKLAFAVTPDVVWRQEVVDQKGFRRNSCIDIRHTTIAKIAALRLRTRQTNAGSSCQFSSIGRIWKVAAGFSCAGRIWCQHGHREKRFRFVGKLKVERDYSRYVGLQPLCSRCPGAIVNAGWIFAPALTQSLPFRFSCKPPLRLVKDEMSGTQIQVIPSAGAAKVSLFKPTSDERDTLKKAVAKFAHDPIKSQLLSRLGAEDAEYSGGSEEWNHLKFCVEQHHLHALAELRRDPAKKPAKVQLEKADALVRKFHPNFSWVIDTCL
jgi:hypothetical protein